jgi:hypothetical protein
MSSSNNQSTENNGVANGLTFNVSDIDITAPKLNKSGGKSANIIYRPTKKSLYIDMQVEMLTWGASAFTDKTNGKVTYDMAIQFPRKEYTTPEKDILLAKFQELERHIKAEALKNSMAWFGKKMTPELIDGAWTPILKYAKDPQTGEPDMTKAPTLKIKLPCYDNKFSCEIYDYNTGSMLFPSESGDVTPMDLIPKAIDIRTIIQCGGIWFANKGFGVTWKLFQAAVTPKPSMKGRCLMAVAPNAQQAKAAAASVASVAVVEDDENSDGEGDYDQPPVRQAPLRQASSVPVLAQPVLAQPVLAQPVVAQPVVAQPVLAQPVLAQPVLAQPIVAQPDVNLETVVHEVAVPAAVVAKPKKVVRKAA